jgi:hypothetical protein
MFAGIRRIRLYDQQIDVAVLSHLARGGGTVQNDLVRVRYGADAPDNLFEKRLVEAHADSLP